MKKNRYEMCGLYCRMKKMLFVMKLIIFAFFFGLMSVSASTYSQSKKITLDLQGVTIVDVFKQIEAQSEFVFIYKNEAINLDNKINVKVEESTIDVILEKVLQNLGVKFEINKKQIIISPDRTIPSNKNEIKIIERVEQPQKKEISGTVKDTKSLSLPGVTVVVKGTTIMGTITDNDGKFRLSVPTNTKTIVFSFVGMISQEITLGNQTILNVVLEEATVGVDEVVIVGYGVQKKASVVGSISQATNEQLKRTGVTTNLTQALTGQLPGVITVTNSGEPGGTGTGDNATSIYIRGQNSWNGGQPLVLVDGIERGLDNIEINEVENISVLKDASATAVFGVKGANGVILVTTKRGTIGKPKISFNYSTTALSISKVPNKLDSYQTLQIKNEAIEREVVLSETSWADYLPNSIVERYKLPQDPNDVEIFPNVDWEKAMFKDVGLSHHLALNISGGTKNVTYFGSLAYLYEGDMFKKYDNNKGYDPNFDFNRINFRSNIDIKLTGTTKLKVNLSGFFSTKNVNFEYREVGGGVSPYAWASAYGMPPDAYLPQYADGSWGASKAIPVNQIPNPVALIWNLGIKTNRQTALNTDFTLEQDLDFITKGLSAKALLFADNTLLSEGLLVDNSTTIDPSQTTANTPLRYTDWEKYTGPGQNPSEYIEFVPVPGVNQFDWVERPWYLNTENAGNVIRRLQYQAQINYDRKFGAHNIGALALFKRQENANGSEFPHYREDWVFRTTYDYNTRYLFEVNGAYNGSEQFGPGYRFAFFPSLGLGWVISNEKFFKIEQINKLKLRFSAGQVGDDNVGGGRWQYASQYNYGGQSRLNANANAGSLSPYTWYKEALVGNPDIHWEKAFKCNYGLEMGLFDNGLTIGYDYFTEDRTDILLAGGSRTSIPGYYGATPPSANLGQVKVNGSELEVKFQHRTKYGFNYWISGSATHSINEIIVKDDPILLASYQKAQGYPISQTRSLLRAGFYNNWDDIYASVPQETSDLGKLPGNYNIVDFNADGIIKASEDAAPTGYPELPQNTFNLTVGGEYKGFGVMLQFYGVNNVSRTIWPQEFYLKTDVLFDHILDYWSKDNLDATGYIPRWKTQGQNLGDYFVYDGSYIRLKTAEISYTCQDKFLKKLNLSGLKIFLNGNNLFFWSKLPDDREGAQSGGSATEGAYPSMKRINLGFDLSF